MENSYFTFSFVVSNLSILSVSLFLAGILLSGCFDSIEMDPFGYAPFSFSFLKSFDDNNTTPLHYFTTSLLHIKTVRVGIDVIVCMNFHSVRAFVNVKKNQTAKKNRTRAIEVPVWSNKRPALK